MLSPGWYRLKILVDLCAPKLHPSVCWAHGTVEEPDFGVSRKVVRYAMQYGDKRYRNEVSAGVGAALRQTDFMKLNGFN